MEMGVTNVHADRLDNSNRMQLLPAAEILLAFGMKPGDRIADIGCGTGFFILPAAAIVGDDGRVFAVDISENMLAETARKVAEAGLMNVEMIQSDGIHIPMDDNSVTITLFCTVLHEVADLISVLGEAIRILQVGGKINIVEWDRRIINFGPPDKHRLGRDALRTVLEKTGFAQIEMNSYKEHFYKCTGVKP
jgi:ubiquinone/menaquinone biosynthesis C-methylase UbiE